MAPNYVEVRPNNTSFDRFNSLVCMSDLDQGCKQSKNKLTVKTFQLHGAHFSCVCVCFGNEHDVLVIEAASLYGECSYIKEKRYV